MVTTGLYISAIHTAGTTRAIVCDMRRGKMGKKYKIKYLMEKRVIDVVEARSPREAIKKLLNPAYFIAEEIKREK